MWTNNEDRIRVSGRTTVHGMRGQFLAPCRILLSLLLAAMVGCRASSGTLTDIGGVGELQNQFNRDAGSTRIVLLMSPT